MTAHPSFARDVTIPGKPNPTICYGDAHHANVSPLSITEACMTETRSAACVLVKCQRTTEAKRELKRLARGLLTSKRSKLPRKTRPNHTGTLSHSWRRRVVSDSEVTYGQFVYMTTCAWQPLEERQAVDRNFRLCLATRPTRQHRISFTNSTTTDVLCSSIVPCSRQQRGRSVGSLGLLGMLLPGLRMLAHGLTHHEEH
jgi:hypothetical protein